MPWIEKLTEGQIARFTEYRDRWTEIALCTTPADRPRAESAIAEMYRQAGLVPPARIVWCGSPLALALTRAIVHKNLMVDLNSSIPGGVGDNVRYAVRDSIGNGVGNNVYRSIAHNVSDTRRHIQNNVRRNPHLLLDDVWFSAFSNIRTRIWSDVRNSVLNIKDGVRDGVRGKRGSIRRSVRNGFWHGPNSLHGSLAVYRYFHDVVGLAGQTSRLSGLWELAQSAGWALPHQNICWVAERHNVLCHDDRHRLHSLTGPACAFPDGWAIHAVHGVRVPAFVIEEPSKITVAAIDTERNAEVRRIMIDRYRIGEQEHGAMAYLQDSGAERLDHDERYGTLWRRGVNDDESIAMVEVINATPEPDGTLKHYWLRVPPEITTAREAVAWTFNISTKDYAPLMES